MGIVRKKSNSGIFARDDISFRNSSLVHADQESNNIDDLNGFSIEESKLTGSTNSKIKKIRQERKNPSRAGSIM